MNIHPKTKDQTMDASQEPAQRVHHWGKRSVSALLRVLLAGQRCTLLPLLRENCTVGGAALVTEGGQVHTLDWTTVPGFGAVLAAAATKEVTTFSPEATEVLPQPPSRCVALELTARVLDGGRNGTQDFTLEHVTKAELGVGIKTDPVPPLGIPMTSQQHEQAAASVEVLDHLRRHLQQKAKAAGVEWTVELEQRVAPYVCQMQQRGIFVDPSWEELVKEHEAEVATLAGRLREELGIQDLNDREVLAALQRRGLLVTGTSREALAQFADQPLVQQIIKWHRLESFCRGLGGAVQEARSRSPDGRVRPRWHQIGCSTGRMSCSSPNLLGVPKTPEVRSKFIPAPGYCFVVADYSAIELRVLAELVDEPTLAEVFRNGGDPHTTTAARLGGKTEAQVTPDERKKAKAVNFGLAYDMGIETLRVYSLVHYGVALTEEEARRAKEVFAQTYPGIQQWHEKTRREMPLETRTPQGRVRYFPNQRDDYNARLASPIQGTVADALKYAIGMVGAKKVRELGGGLVLAVHDELVVEVPLQNAEQTKDELVAVMKAAMERFVKKVPIVVKADIRASWAEE